MKLYARLLLICMFCIMGNTSSAQDITGTWVGNYDRVMLMSNPKKVVVEIFLTNDSLISGTSHLYYKNGKYEHYTIHGKYDRVRASVFFSEDSVLGLKLGFLESNCTGDYIMKLSVLDTVMRLKGKWKDNTDKFLGCPTTGVWFEKAIERKGKKEMSIFEGDRSIPDTVAKSAPELSRKPVFQSLIELAKTEKDSIRVELYDNGEVDHDSVSLYLNDSLVIDRKMITDKPILFYMALSENHPISKLKMVAISQGSLPPCTALMVVTTRKKRYEVKLSSNFDANAVVEFFLKE